MTRLQWSMVAQAHKRLPSVSSASWRSGEISVSTVAFEVSSLAVRYEAEVGECSNSRLAAAVVVVVVVLVAAVSSVETASACSETVGQTVQSSPEWETDRTAETAAQDRDRRLDHQSVEGQMAEDDIGRDSKEAQLAGAETEAAVETVLVVGVEAEMLVKVEAEFGLEMVVEFVIETEATAEIELGPEQLWSEHAFDSW